MIIGNFLNKVRNTPPHKSSITLCGEQPQDGQPLSEQPRGGARRSVAMTRGGGKRATVGAALLIIALAAVAALAGVDSSGIGIGGGISAAQSTTDYDDNDNGLIDVTTLAQLNAIRHDRNGNGDATHATYVAAFPNRDTNAATRMGCPSGTCTGYELRNDLDFDTDDDGDVDSSDSPSFTNWSPLGAPYTAPYTAEFRGNNYTISNLTMTAGDNSLFRYGLFGTLGTGGLITGVGLVDVNINVPSTGQQQSGTSRAGALVGYNRGTVRSSYSTGSVSFAVPSNSLFELGGLVGTNVVGTIAASWSSASVSLNGTRLHSGGLVGTLYTGSVIASYASGPVSANGSTAAHAGGLLGGIGNSAAASVSSSYARGAVTSISGSGGGRIAAGLIAENHSTDAFSVSASYWDVGTTGVADDAGSAAPEGVSTSDLQSLTSYTGIFANWNANIDGAAGADDPWEFGQAMQYPRLKFDSMNQVAQGSLVMGTPGTNNDNPVVGQVARVCLLAGPTQRAAGTGGATYQPWQWYRSTDGSSWGSPISKTGPTYDYTPVAGDVGNYLRACVDVVSSANADRVLGDDRVCAGPFAKVQASGGS